MRALNSTLTETILSDSQGSKREDIFKELSKLEVITLDDVQKVLSNYSIQSLNSKAVPEDLPISNRDVGSSIQITREGSWDYEGVLLDVWYKYTRYPKYRIETITSLMEDNPEPLSWDKTYDDSPRVYDRIVIKTKNKGILIVPYVKGTKIIKRMCKDD